jgi:hypothetical protein
MPWTNLGEGLLSKLSSDELGRFNNRRLLERAAAIRAEWAAKNPEQAARDAETIAKFQAESIADQQHILDLNNDSIGRRAA